MNLFVLLCIPIVGATPVALKGFRASTAYFAAAANSTVLALGIALAVRAVRYGPVTGTGILRVDALSAFMVIVIGAIASLASVIGVRTISFEIEKSQCTPRQAIIYVVLVQGFIFTMLLAVTAANMGVVWVGIEATTIVTTFLVGHRRHPKALEASWKYIVICSVGVALAFLGSVIFYFAAVHSGSRSSSALDWTSLRNHAHLFNAPLVRFAFALIVLGYGTKVGLAPMHSWLPDAHSQAPAPVSALMSGVLLTVAFYAILRFKVITDIALGPGFARDLLVIAGIGSLALAASLLISQHDYKRMLAYHSIEHMGLIALGAAAGIPLAIAGVLLHIVGHGIAKAVLFLASGEILAEEGTSEISEVHALLIRRPALGGIFGIGLLALLGLPPFSLFVSELAMMRGEFQAGLGWVAMISIAAMVVIFISVASHARHMLFGEVQADVALPGSGALRSAVRSQATVSFSLGAALVVCAGIGVIAWPLSALLHAAAQLVAR